MRVGPADKQVESAFVSKKCKTRDFSTVHKTLQKYKEGKKQNFSSSINDHDSISSLKTYARTYTDIQIDRQTDKQTDKQTDRQTNKQIERQIRAATSRKQPKLV